MQQINLTASERKITGRKVKSLRKEGIIPANIYGRELKSTAVSVKEKDFEEVYKKAGETAIVELQLGKAKKPVLIHDVQIHPLSQKPLHVDFLAVDLKKKVATSVPVELIGISPAQASGIGSVVTLLSEIAIEALPLDIPQKFVIDISSLEAVDQIVKASDLDFDPKKVKLEIDPEAIVVKVEPPQKEEVIAPVSTEETAEAKEVEGETAEGETKAEEKPEEAKEENKEESSKA